jgi:hypothetical protein
MCWQPHQAYTNTPMQLTVLPGCFKQCGFFQKDTIPYTLMYQMCAEGNTCMYCCCCCTQNGKRTAFAMLEDCQHLAAAAGSGGRPSRLLLGLQEPVMGLQPLGDGCGVEVTTQKRR